MPTRRVFIEDLRPGRLTLPPTAQHHLTGVLRLESGSPLTAFDAAGRTADAILIEESPGAWALEVGELRDRPPRRQVRVASAVPKGERADWLVEKLAELGIAEWVPLRTARSVVHPEGQGKLSRLQRLAVEAARQSGAPGVTSVSTLTSLADWIARELAGHPGRLAWLCSTNPQAAPASQAAPPDWILIGPEGGWTPEEEQQLLDAGAQRITLSDTTLRIETACILAAGIALSNT